MLDQLLSCPMLLPVSRQCSVFCYTEFSIEIPVAGGAFAYLRIELGDFVAFITAGNILLESIVGSAGLARAWTSYFTALLNRPSNSLRIHTNLAEGFNLLDPIAVAVLAIAATIAMISTRKTSYLNWIASAVNNVIILFVIIAAFVHAKPSNLKPFFPFGAKGVFQASLSIATNIFLMGSLGPEAFERFGICTAVMLIYYVFFGLHATYDVAHKQDMPEESLKIVKDRRTAL